MTNLLDSIPATDNLIMGLISQIFKTSTNPAFKNAKEKQQFLLVVLIVSLFLVVATEPFKLILRKNIGKNALSLFGVIAVCILYFLCAVSMAVLIYEFNYHNDISEYPAYVQFLFNQYILLSGVISYIIFTVFVFARGLNEYHRLKEDKNDELQHVIYRGESIFMKPLLAQGLTEAKIWSEEEPTSCFKFCLILTLIQPIIGLPMFLTSISFWVNEWFHVKYKWLKLQDVNKKMNIATASFNANFPKQNSSPVQ